MLAHLSGIWAHCFYFVCCFVHKHIHNCNTISGSNKREIDGYSLEEGRGQQVNKKVV